MTCLLTFSLPSKNLSSVQRTNYPIQSWLLFHHHNHHIPSHVHHLPRLSPLMYLISNHPHSTNQHNNPPNSVDRSQDQLLTSLLPLAALLMKHHRNSLLLNTYVGIQIILYTTQEFPRVNIRLEVAKIFLCTTHIDKIKSPKIACHNYLSCTTVNTTCTNSNLTCSVDCMSTHLKA